MKKILSFFLGFFIIFSFFINTNITNAAGLDATWKLVDKTQSNHFKILKGTPFKFSFYNKLYNYFRLTDDGALVFGISPDNINLDEGLYLKDKNDAIIKVSAGESVILTFDVDKTKIVIPNGINYININGQYKISDGTTPVDMRKGNQIELSDGEELISNSGLYGIEIDDETKLSDIHDNVKYDDTGTDNYVMITPGFINLDLSDKDNKGHGIYEKSYIDSKGQLYATGYMWYGYVEGTTKEVQYGIVLYNSTYYNNIRLFYGEIDSSITDTVFVGISNGNASDKLNVAYSNSQLGDLSLKDDIVIDGSKIFQELIFSLGYEPDPLDVNSNFIIDYQERDTVSPYPFLDKPQSKFAIKFKVKINTDRTVCQREWVTSDGGDTLRWGKKDSARVDFDDIDTFCFSAETPGIVVLDNATYAKGGYKTGQSKCVVNHLSLMGFNAQSIGWNTNLDNNCWLTYKIKESSKDLSLEKDSPYAILNKFLDDVDIRPVDTTITINNQSIVFGSPKALIIETDTGNQEMAILDPDFKPIELDMITSQVAYIIGYNGTDSYLLYTNNRGDSWKILYKMENKNINYFTVIDNVVLIFFYDGTYIRNIENGFGEWKEKELEGYDIINDIGLVTNRRILVIGNNGKIWKTYSAGDDFELLDAKTEYDLQAGEHLQSIDIYGSNDIWISSNRGNILYSPNAGDSFYKKTTGSSMEYSLNNFEDGINVFQNTLGQSNIGNYLSYIDPENNKSLKFANDYQYLNGCMDWNNAGQDYVTDTTNYTNLEPFTVDEYDKIWPKGDLYIEYYIDTKDSVKKLNSLILEDDYGHTITVNVDKIFTDNGETQKLGWNKLKVEIRDYLSDDYEFNAPDNTTSTAEHFQKISKYTLSDTSSPLESGERIGIGKIQFAPSTNLTNITTINEFDTVMSDTSTRTCKLDSNLSMTNLIDGNLNLNSFIDSEGDLNGFLTLDIYIEDKNKWGIDSIELGNDNNKKIVWNDIKKFSSLGINVLNNGWNTFIFPFNEDNSANATYVNKNDINWENLTYLKVNSFNSDDTTYNRYALDNIRYSSVADTNLKFIKFFNTKEGLAFDDSNSYITNNNNTWGMNGSYSRGAGTDMEFKKVIKIKGREVYAMGNDDQGWFTYYSLDKGKNSKLHFSDSGINLKTFDLINFDDGLGISENGTIYEFQLQAD